MADTSANIPALGTLLTAMVTPFTKDGKVDYGQAAELASKLVDDGCDGLVVTGTTGETSTLTDEENLGMFRAVKDAVGGRAAIIAGTGTNDTAHSVHLSQQAAALGVDGLLLVTPYYNKPSQAGVRAHFETIASSTDVPVMLYDIPGRSSIPIEPDTMIRLAQHPNIVAVKDAKADFTAATRVMAETDLLFYSGDDGLTLPWMALGAVGLVGVTTHVSREPLRPSKFLNGRESCPTRLSVCPSWSRTKPRSKSSARTWRREGWSFPDGLRPALFRLERSAL
jgi:4-hydroxy-tetrahydrodipicolinate synthase